MSLFNWFRRDSAWQVEAERENARREARLAAYPNRVGKSTVERNTRNTRNARNEFNANAALAASTYVPPVFIYDTLGSTNSFSSGADLGSSCSDSGGFSSSSDFGSSCSSDAGGSW